MNESMEATPDLTKTLLFDRNANWAGQLQARMDQPGTVFVAVGAGHLAGQHSVQDYLKERGLTVTRVDYFSRGCSPCAAGAAPSPRSFWRPCPSRPTPTRPRLSATGERSVWNGGGEPGR